MNRLLVVTLAVALTACSGGSDGPTTPGNNPPGGDPPGGGGGGGGSTLRTITLQGVSFSPSTLTIPAGTTVAWTNGDGMLHSVTPEGHTQWTATTSATSGEVLRVTLNTPGTYDYFCEPHQPTMTGRIIVQ